MRICALGLAAMVAACTSIDEPSDPCVYSPSPGDDAVDCYAVDVTASSPFSELAVMVGLADTASSTGQAILTPGLLAAGAQPPAHFDFAYALVLDQPVAPAATSYRWLHVEAPIDPSSYGVIAALGSDVIGAGWSSLEAPPPQLSSTTDVVYGAALIAAPSPTLELWGVNATCLRAVDGGGVTHYLIADANDDDCDGIPNATDCEPTTYCETTVAACTCPAP